MKPLGEFELIESLIQGSPAVPPGYVGPGDDCSIYHDGQETWIMTTDLLVEGTHFRREWCSWYDIGTKALMVNLSDIAAMGGLPFDYYVTLARPATVDDDALRSVYNGMRHAAEGTILGGGDTTTTDGPLVVSITVRGRMAGAAPLLRSNARAGDKIYVSGPLGGAAAGLAACLHGHVSDGRFQPFYDRLHRPEARIRLGRTLAGAGVRTAIDISDGLSSELLHLCRASECGCRVNVNAVPPQAGLTEAARALDTAAEPWLLHGGDVYELLFTVPAEIAAAVERAAARTGACCSQIGTITAEHDTVWCYPQERFEPITAGGWAHF